MQRHCTLLLITFPETWVEEGSASNLLGQKILGVLAGRNQGFTGDTPWFCWCMASQINLLVFALPPAPSPFKVCPNTQFKQLWMTGMCSVKCWWIWIISALRFSFFYPAQISSTSSLNVVGRLFSWADAREKKQFWISLVAQQFLVCCNHKCKSDGLSVAHLPFLMSLCRWLQEKGICIQVVPTSWLILDELKQKLLTL